MAKTKKGKQDIYAIVESGGRQYKISVGDQLDVELLPHTKKAKEVKLDNVLLYSDGKEVKVGQPFIKGASVACDLVGEVKGPKVISYEFRRRKSSKKKIGHRQKLTRLLVKEIKAKE